MSLLFAATYPERVAALVMRSAFPRTMWAPDYPWGRSEEEARENLKRSAAPVRAARRGGGECPRAPEWEDADIPAIVDYLRWCGSPGRSRSLRDEQRDRRAPCAACHSRPDARSFHGSEDRYRSAGSGPLDGRSDTRCAAASRSRAPATSTSAGAPTRSIAEVRAFVDAGLGLRALGQRRAPIACSRRCSSPTSSTRASGWPRWATAPGASCWSATTGSSGASSQRFRGAEVDTAGDGFFACFDGPARGIRCASAIVDA